MPPKRSKLPEKANNAAPTAPDQSNIVMWGAPACGKTTFLAALSIALNRRRDGWKVIGADTPSTQALIRLTSQLTDDREFPTATSMAFERYRWFLVGQKEERAGRWFRRRTVQKSVRIGLDLMDLGGERFAAPKGAVSGELTDNLVGSRGIVFLFDPVREFDEGDAFKHLFGVLSHLSQHMLDSDEFEGGQLPHYLAVCITKFDEIRVLETAQKLYLAQPEPEDDLEFPRVSSEDAKELFYRLCEISASGNAEMVTNTLEKYFRHDRIRYFVTSAIGFYVDPQVGVYDPDDFQNVVSASDGYSKIRGTVHPINVMEPMLWLGQQLTQKRG
jgi:hypothetical protein